MSISVFAKSAYDAITVNNLLDTTSSWSGEELPEQTHVTLREFIIQPGEKTAVHQHAITGAGIILSGQLTMYETRDKLGKFQKNTEVKKIVLNQGETWSESVGRWHYGVNMGDKPAHFLVAFVGDKSKPVATPLPSH